MSDETKEPMTPLRVAARACALRFAKEGTRELKLLEQKNYKTFWRWYRRGKNKKLRSRVEDGVLLVPTFQCRALSSLLRICEARKLAKVTRRCMVDWIEAGKVKAVAPMGRERYVIYESLAEFLASRSTGSDFISPKLTADHVRVYLRGLNPLEVALHFGDTEITQFRLSQAFDLFEKNLITMRSHKTYDYEITLFPRVVLERMRAAGISTKPPGKKELDDSFNAP